MSYTRPKNKKVCIICGRIFEDPPSNKTVTCSPECRKKYAVIRATGRRVSDETKEKLSKVGKNRDMSNLQKVAVKAAQASPKSGRFETNQNAIDWHLISPSGKPYYFHSLNFWLRQNCRELFGIEPDSKEFKNTTSGLTGAKRAMLGGSYGCTTYKGWRVIPTESDIDRKQEV